MDAATFWKSFKKRRGYDLKPHLPALVNDMGPQTKGLRRDWGRTLTELLNERFLAPDAGVVQTQPHAVSDSGLRRARRGTSRVTPLPILPDGEGAQWKVVRAARWASSASHLYGRPVASSETWTWLHSPSFRATPLDMKAEADLHFLQGINQLIGHGWPYTAPGVEYPGWRFYAAGVFNEKNPWWIVMPDMARYLQRVSFMMRQGQPANDVALYLPNDDAYASITPGRDVNLRELLVQRVGRELIPQLLEAGHNFDFFDDDAFKQTGRLEKGALWLGSNRYQIVILPNVETMRPETYKRFEEFVRGGGTLIATRQTPSKAPGLKASESDHGLIKETSQRLFTAANAPARLVQDPSAPFKDVIGKAAFPT